MIFYTKKRSRSKAWYILGGVLVLGTAAVFVPLLPDLWRYMKIRQM